MDKILAIIFCFLLVQTATAQEQTVSRESLLADVHGIIITAKKYSVYRHQVHWDNLENSIMVPRDLILGFKEYISVIQKLLTTMGDRHAAFYVSGHRIRMQDPDPVVLRPSLVQQIRMHPPRLFSCMLPGRYGYLSLPGNTPGDPIYQLGQDIQDSLCTLMQQGARGIILDLRANEGGSLFPLFTGLHQLIGNGVFGAFTNMDGSLKDPWILRKGKFIQHGRIVASVKPRCRISKTIKVAVLLSQVTASAGEMVAIALKGRKHTLFIGEPTYGLTTGATTFKVNGHTLALSTTLTEDRDGQRYPFISPDVEIVEGDDFGDLMNDKKVQAALQWLGDDTH